MIAPTTESSRPRQVGGDVAGATIGALGFRFALHSTDRALGRYLAEVLAPLSVPEPAEHDYELEERAGGAVAVLLDGRLLEVCHDRRHAAEWVLWHVDEQALASVDRDHVVLHAGAVQCRGAGVLIPGPSGAGKSTLVAALVERGLAYLSDEIVVLADAGTRLVPYPRPLQLRPGAQEALPGWRPPSHFAEVSPERWAVPVDGGRRGPVGQPCTPALVISPELRLHHRSALTDMAPTDTLVALVANSVHVGEPVAEHVTILAGLARRCPGYRLEVGDLETAGELVAQLVAGLADACEVEQ